MNHEASGGRRPTRGATAPPTAAGVARLQEIDALLGPPLCAALSLLSRIIPKRAAPSRPRSIVFVKLSEQGATVLAAPALREAIQRVGKTQVHFVAFESNREILDLMNLLPPENVHEIAISSTAAFLRTVIGCGMKLQKLQIDACIDLDFFSRGSAILSWLTGAPVRVGLHAYFGEGPYRGSLTTHRCRYNPHLHTARFFLSLVHALDQAPATFPAWTAPASLDKPPVPRADLPASSTEAASRMVRELLQVDHIPVLVLLNANCSDLVPLRRWMPERYVSLANKLLDSRPDVSVLFTGSAAEQADVERLVAEVGSTRCRSVAGQTSLPELLALYNLSAVLVTNDSGPAHFSSLTSVNTVALYGPETPALFGPLSPSAVSLTASLPCSPCVSTQNNRQSACRDNLCLKAISVETVYDAVCACLPLAEPGEFVPSPASVSQP